MSLAGIYNQNQTKIIIQTIFSELVYSEEDYLQTTEIDENVEMVNAEVSTSEISIYAGERENFAGLNYYLIKIISFLSSRKLKGPTARGLNRKQTAICTQHDSNEKIEEIEKNLRKRAIWLKKGITYAQIDPNFEFYQGKTVNICTRIL